MPREEKKTWAVGSSANVSRADGGASNKQRTGGLPVVMKRVAKVLLLLFLISFWLIVLLRWVAPPTSSFMIQKKIASLFSADAGGKIAYHWIDYDDISPYAKMAVIAAEDQKFPLHYGFDLQAIEKAVEQSKRGKRLRGASTISQQVAKNLFLWPGRSFIRKGLEAYLTVLLELLWSKQRILEVYLNIAQMGDWVYGVGAASEVFFKESASQLTRHQAALLAAVLPNPERYSVARPSRYVRHRQRWILRQMRQLGGTDYLAGL